MANPYGLFNANIVVTSNKNKI